LAGGPTTAPHVTNADPEGHMGRPRKTRPAEDDGGGFGDPTLLSAATGDPGDPASRRGILGRRALLAGTAASSLLAADVVLGGPARAATPDSPAAGGPGTLHLCVVTDTHANVDAPDRLTGLRTVFTSIEAADPDVVLHCGDISDYGASDEYAAYLAAVPRGLRPRLRHVPGDHEARWDEQALHTYSRLFGPAPHSFDIDGIHVVGLNPTQLLQEPGHFGAEHLDWLRQDLQATGRSTPVLMFVHYPMGGTSYFVNDQDDFFAAIAGYDVRAIFAGHTHEQAVVGINGLVQLTGAAAFAAPSYYDLQRVAADAGSRDRLEVEVVTPKPDGTETRMPVATIPLTGPRLGGRLTPTWARVGETTGGLDLSVRMPPRSQAATISALIYPQATFGHQNAGQPVDLAGGDGHFAGRVDTSALPPGHHRLTIRATAAPGAGIPTTHEQTKAFTITRGRGRDAIADGPRIAWTHRLPGRVQAGLAISTTGHGTGPVVVAATTSGRIESLVISGASFLPEWQVTLGPVYRTPVFSSDGATLVVGDADGTLHALAADTGAKRWRANLGGPVLGSPLMIQLAGRDVVVVAAGRQLHARYLATGSPVWSTSIGGFSAGRAAFDGSVLVTGSGDGSVRALDAATGSMLWSTSVTDRETAYLKLIYGAWNSTVTSLPGGLALVSTVSSARALRVVDGSIAWTVLGSYLYTPSTPIPSSLGARDLLLIDEFGRASRVDAVSGTVRWSQTDARATVPRSLDGGPVLRSGRAWLLGTTGLLAAVRLADGVVELTHQLSTANTFSTPVLHGSTLIAGDQSGLLRGITLP
jgi:outer membrane protein assembly factor BamB/3',5'-cyclic AMP phosphodiesterase CpdA